jgi:hypothetical protein
MPQQFNSQSTVITAGFATEWDGNGDHYANDYQPQKGIKSLGHLWLGVSQQTANFTMNETTGATDSNNATVYQVSTAGGDVLLTAASISAVATTTKAKFVIVTKTTSDANRVLYDGAGTELAGQALVLALYRKGDSATFYADNSTTGWQLAGGRPNVIYATVAASTAVTGTASETTFSNGSFTIPANTLYAGEIIEIEGQGTNTSGNAADTLTVKLYIGATAICTTAAFNVTDGGGDIFYFRARVCVRDIGATGHIVAAGVQSIGVPATATALPFFLASTAVDTTAAQTIAVKATWSSSSGSNSCRLDVLTAQRAA